MPTIPKNVLSAKTDLDQIVNDGRLSVTSRRRRIRDRRGQALVDQLVSSLRISNEVVLGDWKLSIDSCEINSSGAVELRGVKAFKNGVAARIDPHRLFVNPPLLFQDPNGDVSVERISGLPSKEGGQPVTFVEKYRIDPAAVMLLEVLGAAERGETHEWSDNDLATVATIYASASGYADSWGSKAQADAGTGTVSVQNNINVIYVGRNYSFFHASQYSALEGFTSFDTTSISTSAIVSALECDLYYQSGTYYTYSPQIYYCVSTWGASVDATDYEQQPATIVATGSVQYSNAETSGYKVQAVDTTNGIVKGGTTQYKFVSTAVYSGSADAFGGAGGEYVTFSDQTAAGTTQDPKLVVTYTIPQAPNAPTGLGATLTTDTTTRLDWTAGAVDGSHDAATLYKIERAPDVAGSAGTYVQIDTRGGTTYTEPGGTLTPLTKYWYRVRASNGGGNSGYSSAINITTLGTGKVKRYTGSAWQQKPVKTSAGVVKPLKYFDGSVWKRTP